MLLVDEALEERLALSVCAGGGGAGGTIAGTSPSYTIE